MKTRSKILVAALMATVAGGIAVPVLADSQDGPSNQLAFYGPGRDRDGDGPGRDGWRDGKGRPGPGDRFAHYRPGGPGMGPGGPGMGPGGPRFGMFGMGHGGGFAVLVERFDVNKDGTITSDEIASVNADRVKSYDKDGDGKLSLEEFTVLWVDTNKERIVRDFQARDPDGDAKVTLDEYAKPFARMLSMLDRNNDGSIDATEMSGPRGDHGPGPGMRGPRGPGDQSAPAAAPPPPAAPDGGPDAPE